MPRYVVLEHRWRGTHWDLMFERQGTLATWAVDQPIVAGVDTPARRLPDHRLAYLDYQGPISGDRGEVSREDAGRYEALCWDSDRVVLRLSGGRLTGIVELRRPASGAGAEWIARFGKVD